MDCKTHIFKTSVLPKMIYKNNTIPTIIPGGFLNKS